MEDTVAKILLNTNSGADQLKLIDNLEDEENKMRMWPSNNVILLLQI